MAEYIDKAAVYEKLNNLPHEYRNAEQRARTGGIAACKEIVRYFPAADVVEVRHGHFGKHTSPFTAPCSECGTSMNTSWHYCYNCGASMEADNG